MEKKKGMAEGEVQQNERHGGRQGKKYKGTVKCKEKYKGTVKGQTKNKGMEKNKGTVEGKAQQNARHGGW